MAGGNLDQLELPRVGRQLLLAVWWSSLVLVVAIAGMLAGRRMAGALTAPLDGRAMLGAAVVIVLGAVLLQRTQQRTQARGSVGLVVPAIAAALGLAAITLPGAAPWSVALAWFGFVTAEASVLYGAFRPRRIAHRSARTSPAIEWEGSEEPADESVSEQLIQQLRRERTPSGGETIHALVRATCPPGDRFAVVHLAFCPPLDCAPRLAAHVLDDSGAEAKITSAQTYGMRIELRLPQIARGGQSILLEVVGEADVNSPAPDQTPASTPHRHL
jgi:hypothetical protein